MDRMTKIIFKIGGPRSRLYRRRFLQVNTRWKALDEIYKIYILLHRSDLKVSAKNRQHVYNACRFFNRICENRLDNCRKFWNLWKLFIIIYLEGGWLLVSNFGYFFMIFGYFMIFFLVSFKKNEIITGLSVFLSVKNDIFAVCQSYQRQTMRLRRWW